MKNRKKTGKKTKKKGAAAMKNVPVKKPTVANSIPGAGACSTNLASSSADVVDKKDSKDTKPTSQPASPANSVTMHCI